MQFFNDHLPAIFNGLVVGGLFSYTFIKISSLKEELNFFKDCYFRNMQEDVRNLERQDYGKATREDLVREVNYLTQRILVIETKMEEREKAKERS